MITFKFEQMEKVNMIATTRKEITVDKVTNKTISISGRDNKGKRIRIKKK